MECCALCRYTPAFAAIGQTGLADRYLYIPMLVFRCSGNTISRHMKNAHLWGLLLIVVYTIQSARILPYWQSTYPLCQSSRSPHHPTKQVHSPKRLKKKDDLMKPHFGMKGRASSSLTALLLQHHVDSSASWRHESDCTFENALVAGCEPLPS